MSWRPFYRPTGSWVRFLMCFFVVFQRANIPNWIILLLFVINFRMDPYENNKCAQCMTWHSSSERYEMKRNSCGSIAWPQSLHFSAPKNPYFKTVYLKCSLHYFFSIFESLRFISTPPLGWYAESLLAGYWVEGSKTRILAHACKVVNQL